mgnify:CR=1 FL=1
MYAYHHLLCARHNYAKQLTLQLAGGRIYLRNRNNMPVVTIPKQLAVMGELVVIPKKEYQGFLELQKIFKKRMAEERDTDDAIAIYQREKQRGTLRSLTSLRDLR